MISRSRYNKAEDHILLPMIRGIGNQRPSNGYRRVTAHLSRHLKASKMSLKQVNHKRIYRIMKQHDLLLTRSKPLQNDHTHEGKVIVSDSNKRWCSDGFEIKCWNGEKVRVIFSLDCCDREIMSYAATTAGISSEMVCDALVQSMERRSVWSLIFHIQWSGLQIMAVVVLLVQHVHLLSHWDFVFVQYRFAVHKVMEWLKPLLKRLSVITCI